MPPVIFSIVKEKAGSFPCWRSPDALEKLINHSFLVSVSGTPQEQADQCRFEFGDKKSKKDCYAYLKKLRNKPSFNSFDEKLAESLGRIWLSSKVNIPLFEKTLSAGEAILLSVKEENAQALTNIPWEIGHNHINRVSPAAAPLPSNTIASLPFGRVISDLLMEPKKISSDQQLRVLCCISDPDPANPLNGAAFYNDMTKIATKHQWLIDFRFVNGNHNVGGQPDFKPLLKDLLLEIEHFEPHLFILVSHGDSKNGAKIYFQEESTTRYKWEDIHPLARALQQTRCCLSAVLVACDLSFSPEGYAANSGAMNMLKQGIPSVIAMQTKVLVSAGDVFIDSVLAYFTRGSGNVAPKHFIHAVSFGRRQIANTLGTPEHNIDWSFPALFFTADGYDQLAKLEEFIDTYAAWLTNLELFSFVMPANYLDRPIPQKQLMVAINNSTGLLKVGGDAGTGKSACLKKICLDTYSDVKKFQTQRPVIYLDFEDDENETFSIADRFFDVLNNKIKKVTTFNANPAAKDALFRTIPILKEVTEAEQLNQFVKWLDVKPRIFILDNLAAAQLEALAVFIDQAKQLKNSLLVVTMVPGKTANITIGSLSKEEVKAYCNLFSASGVKEETLELVADSLYEYSGGNLLVLSECRVPELMNNPSLAIDLAGTGANETKVSDMLVAMEATTGLKEAYIKLVNFPGGIIKGMNRWMGITDEILDTLLNQQLLVEQFAKGKDPKEKISVYKVPKYARLAIKKDHAGILREQMELLKLELGSYFTSDDEQGLSSEEKILELITTITHLDFLRDTIDMLAGLGDTEPADYIMLIIDTPLYEQGRLQLLSYYWTKVLQHLPEESQSALYWIRLIKTQLLSGYVDKAMTALDKVEALLHSEGGNDPVNEAEFYMYSALAWKDKGDTEKESLMEDYYKKAEELIGKAVAEDQSDDVLKIKKALVYYNKANFEFWWKRDAGSAAKDMAVTMEITQPIYPWLYNLSMSERADMLIDNAATGELDSLKEQLLNAAEFFKSYLHPVQLAYAYYRLARLEKRRWLIAGTSDETAVFKYYKAAAKIAKETFFSEIEWIAAAKILLLQIDLRQKAMTVPGVPSLSDKDIIANAQKIAANLKTLQSSWPKRVARMLEYGVAGFVRKQSAGDKEQIGKLYRDVLDYAASVNFSHAKPGTDRTAVITIYNDYIDFLSSSNDSVELDAVRHKYGDRINVYH
jgi:tetratricopeptide (TPR) repeat protein